MIRVGSKKREDEQRQERVGALVGCEPTDEAEENLARVEQLDELAESVMPTGFAAPYRAAICTR